MAMSFRSTLSGPKASGPDTSPLPEIVELLAAGLMRLRARKSSRSRSEPGESSLHFSAAKSGDPAGLRPESCE